MTVTKNRVISIDYTLTDSSNNVIDSTSGQEPLDYLHGFGNIVPGLENALEGKAQNDHFSVSVPAAEAYGERDERLIADIPLENFKGVDEVKPGMQFHAESPDGINLITVTKVADNTVTIDGNHPLAGQDLTFDVTVTAIREATEEEIAHGHIHSHDHGCGGECGEGCCGGGRGECGCEDENRGEGGASRGSEGCCGGCHGH